ncbi:hypothetical protein SAMN02910276_02016 [Butyrivibrio sp. Su6]|uniref:hypothetical protein n=1 Tax=Butyrivibrio sp. Su6 TaxID=1520810 RepID=UPI00089E2C5A|nr:hypothetical protein [Butyrivibrio sp. Su6]SEG15750.1 hypothetical protein SAMN02910276_02016 [Butyrivibrio sp. Su6]
MDSLKVILKMLTVLILAVVFAGLVMTILYTVPTERMVRHVLQSKDMYLENKIPNWSNKQVYSTIDNYSDAIMLNTAIC